MKTLDEALDLWRVGTGQPAIAQRYLSIGREAAQTSPVFQQFLDENLAAKHPHFFWWAIRQLENDTPMKALALDALGACKLCGSLGVSIGIEMEKP